VAGLRSNNKDLQLSAICGERVPEDTEDATTRLSIIRGIRYYFGFAKELHGTYAPFTRALNARSIMSDVIPDMIHPGHFPYCIWHPEAASAATYRELGEARECSNPHYLRDLEAKVASGMAVPPEQTLEVWKKLTFKEQFAANRAALKTCAMSKDVAVDSCRWMYNGRLCNATDVEFNVCAPDELRAGRSSRRSWTRMELCLGKAFIQSLTSTNLHRGLKSLMHSERLLHSPSTHGNLGKRFSYDGILLP